jgi:hypothetical protein
MWPATLSAQHNGSKRPEELEAKAKTMFGKPEHFKSAAHLLREAARLRAADDTVALNNLQSAGWFFYYAGDATNARAAFQETAERAVAAGAIEQAAHAYVDGAFVAVEERHPQAAAFLGHAERLAASPKLTEDQRDVILRRIAPMRSVVPR